MDSPPSDLIARQKDVPHRSLKTVGVWALTMLTSALFIAAAVPKLGGGYSFFAERFQEWGYPGWFETGVGIAEVVSAIFLIIPTTAFYAAGVLAVIMLGAIYTHVALGVAAYAVLPAVMLCAVAIIGWVRRPQRFRSTKPRVTTTTPRNA
ncbi:DoxX family protein [Persicimonas caeni]|jgi:uncharacterized membrane protein YphA (DoxX/SURF4 family)|nr:DoxX family protein [Persicimonas caeni]